MYFVEAPYVFMLDYHFYRQVRHLQNANITENLYDIPSSCYTLDLLTPYQNSVMQKVFKDVTKKAVEGNTYTKFTQPKISRGKTVFPSGPQLQKQLGVRYTSPVTPCS